jgi:hypothetical protein
MNADGTLDGNVAAGVLGEVFAAELTAAVARCDACGTTGALGELHAYVGGPGTVLRCLGCQGVLLRVVRDGDRCWIDLRGLRWLQFSV